MIDPLFSVTSNPLIPDSSYLAETYGENQFIPDDHKAYVEFEICSTLPNVHGPEKHGRIFGFHPQVVAKSYQTMLYSLTNFGHTLKRHGASSDRINGCVIAVSFPERPKGGWKIAMGDQAAMDSAPRVKALAVIYKDAAGVPQWIGSYLGGREKTSVSIEADPSVVEVLDPSDGEFYTMAEARTRFGSRVVQYKQGHGWVVGKFEGRQLVQVPGGRDGNVNFFGVGYVQRPAESVARITSFQASREGCEWQTFVASSMWDQGMIAGWMKVSADDSGFGEVLEVIDHGKVTMHGITFQASMAVPLLRIRPNGKNVEIIRPADRVKLLD